ncbi:hypothetical protein ACFSMW_14785 [Virgibacillus halophilus]|uniref:Uncharacterized protein n=1 Tax=Tigheibacillus halophilus TaxID=361280 RepID=A0ABU5CBU6_9BACI|nr:hypothetical protein [Virgibacillus halophilus]
MEQTNIYDFLVDMDPVLSKIKNLAKGQAFVLEQIRISLNPFGLYEVESADFHQQFVDCQKCYQFVCKVTVQRGEEK